MHVILMEMFDVLCACTITLIYHTINEQKCLKSRRVFEFFILHVDLVLVKVTVFPEDMKELVQLVTR